MFVRAVSVQTKSPDVYHDDEDVSERGNLSIKIRPVLKQTPNNQHQTISMQHQRDAIGVPALETGPVEGLTLALPRSSKSAN